jgi:hypothetical protein
MEIKMKKLSDYLGEELSISRISVFKREFEFRSSNELIAKMYFPKFFSLSAIVDGFDEKLEIKATSFWRSDLGIFKSGYEMPFAKYTSTSFWKTKGVLELPKGEQLNIKFGTFKRSCEIYSSSEELLVLFQNKFSFKDKNIITIEQRSDVIDQYPWVIMVAWYKILQRNRRNSAAG